MTTQFLTGVCTRVGRHLRRERMVPKISIVSGLVRNLSKRKRAAIRVPVLPTPALDILKKWDSLKPVFIVI